MLSVVALAFVAGIVLLGAIGRPVAIPDWINTKAQSRITSLLPGNEVTFETATLLIEDNWQPRFRLQNVVVTNASDHTEVRFSELDTALSLTALMDGQVAPKSIALSGVFVTLRRDVTGQINISLGNAGQNSDESKNLSTMLAGLDAALAQDQLRHLRTIDIDSVTLRYEDLRAQRGWTVDGGRMKLIRYGNTLSISADLALLSGRDYATTLVVDFSKELGERQAELAVTFEDMASTDIASQSPALAWLDILKAPISGALRLNVEQSGELGALQARLQIGEGVLQPNDAVRPIPFRFANSNFAYDPRAQELSFDELSIVSEWISVRAAGTAQINGLETGWPEELVAQFQLSEFSGNPAGLFDQPVAMERVDLDFRLKLDPFDLTLGQMTIQDSGQRLVLGGQLSASGEDWTLALDGHMDALESDRLMALWPSRTSPNTRNWLNQNVLSGALSDINLAVRSKPGSAPDTYLDFKFADADVRFLKTLPAAVGASGYATWENERLVVVAESGVVPAAEGGEIDISGTAFVVPDVRIKQTPAEVNLKTTSTITAALSMLDQPPFGFISKAKLPVTLADGRADIAGKIKLLLVKNLPVESVLFDLTAELSDVSSRVLVKDKLLSSVALTARATEKEVSIFGPGRIGSVPFEGVWKMGLGAERSNQSTIDATLELSERFVEEFRIGLTSDMFSGISTAQLHIDLVQGSDPAFSLTSDLQGAGLKMAPLGWQKSKSQSGKLVVVGKMTAPPTIESIKLDAADLSLSGTVKLTPIGGLHSLAFDNLKIADWLSVQGRLVGRGPQNAPEVVVTGGRVDMRRAPQNVAQASSGNSVSGPINAKLDIVQVSDGIALHNLTGAFSTTGGMSGNFNGSVNGGAQVTGVVVPQDGRSAFRIKSADAGGVLLSTGIIKTVHGGGLDLSLVPVGNVGNYAGNLKIKSIRVREAPAMAELLNAISVVGLLEQLGGQGISFAEVDSIFTLTPDRIIVKQGSAVGPSMGISMDGVYGLESGKFDMQGVLSPIYIVNAVGRLIARKGEGLIGFNYSLRGTAAEPKVQVNPLSVLTPGIFRDIFRRPPPKGVGEPKTKPSKPSQPGR
jgi:hypothetical protein